MPLPILEIGRDLPQARDRCVDQLSHRPQPVEKEAEDAAQARVEIGVGLASPHQEVVDDPSPVENADHQVAVDRVVEGELVRIHLVEAGQPRGIGPGSSLEGGLGEVVELVVVLGQAEPAGMDRRVRHLGVEELSGELGEGRHAETSCIGLGVSSLPECGPPAHSSSMVSFEIPPPISIS